MRIDEILDLDYAAPQPKHRRRGIGIIGAGGIVNEAHLPAYAKAGFNVVAIYDARADAARQTAARFAIGSVCESVEDLLRRPDVDIVDIAVTPEGQAAIAPQAMAAGKHLLCQKPLSDDYRTAAGLVATARKAGVLLAVNQQMRWSPAIRLAPLHGGDSLTQFADLRIDGALAGHTLAGDEAFARPLRAEQAVADRGAGASERQECDGDVRVLDGKRQRRDQ